MGKNAIPYNKCSGKAKVLLHKTKIRNAMEKKSLYNFLNEIENLQMFALCKDFDELSLEDNTGGSSSSSSSTSLVQPSSYGYRGTFHPFLRSWAHSLWSQSIIEQLRAPFIELPRHFMDSSSFQSYDIRMGFGFRFLPGQSQFLTQELKLPESFDRLSFLSHSLGLSYNSRPLSAKSLFSFSSSGAGLRGLVTDGFTKILVEVITYYDGRYGRFLVQVCLGIGCTVWYAFAPGSALHAPDCSLFAPFDSYDPFFNMEYYAPGFRRVGFVERNDVSASVVSALGNELPFAEITIPASGHVLKAVGLGVMVAFFLAVGLVPNVSGSINVQL